jgi:hypothetical protein
MDLDLIKRWFRKQPSEQQSTSNSANNQQWRFWTTWPGLSVTYPIIPTDQIPVPWLGSSRQYLQSLNQKLNHPTTNAAHLCSGITASLTQGWTVTSWCDFIITTNGDSTSFEWRLPQRIGSKYPSPIIEHFDSQLWGDHANLPPNTLKTLIKYNTPWCFWAPPGWGLLVAPLQYHNESRFTNALGIIDPARGNQLNALLLWHEPNKQTLVRAGTPLFQMYPVPLARPQAQIQEANSNEMDFHITRDFLFSNTFASNRDQAQKLYEYYRSKSQEN